jgi:hypothetical protein
VVTNSVAAWEAVESGKVLPHSKTRAYLVVQKKGPACAGPSLLKRAMLFMAGS